MDYLYFYSSGHNTKSTSLLLAEESYSVAGLSKGTDLWEGLSFEDLEKFRGLYRV